MGCPGPEVTPLHNSLVPTSIWPQNKARGVEKYEEHMCIWLGYQTATKPCCVGGYVLTDLTIHVLTYRSVHTSESRCDSSPGRAPLQTQRACRIPCVPKERTCVKESASRKTKRAAFLREAIFLTTICRLSCFHSATLLCPWDSPGKNPGVGCHALLQGIFLI